MNDYILQQGMEESFKKAKKYRITYFAIAWIILLLPICIEQIVSSSFAIFVLFILRGTQFFFNFISKKWISRGRRWHQQNLFLNGLGEHPSALTFVEITSQCGVIEKKENTYFASQENVGPSRLVENVSESAFYTASYASIYKWFFAVPALSIAITIAYFLINGFGALDTNLATKLIITLASFFLFGDLATRFLELNTLDETCNQLAIDGIKMLENGKDNISMQTSKEFTFKYVLSLNNISPLPTWLHNFKKDDIEKAWFIGLEAIKQK